MVRVSVRSLLVTALAGSLTCARAQPVGVDTCDAFLTAYERCAASPGLPDAVGAGLRSGIAAMRQNFIRDAARGDRARDTVAAQCGIIHQSVRTGLVQQFKCDFPPPAPGTITAQSDAPRASRERTLSPEQQDVAKSNLYVEAHNSLVEHRNLAKDLADYVDANQRVLGLNPRAAGNDWLQFGITNVDIAIDRLTKAAAISNAMPELDPKAATLLAALQEVNPIIKALDRYQTTREFKEDKYKFARDQHPVFVARMKVAIAASTAFGDAIFEREMSADERRLASLPRNSVPQTLLATSLSARRAVRLFEAASPNSDTAALKAAMSDLSNANETLLAAIDGATPKPDSNCASYSQYIDTMIGAGRDVARDIKAGSRFDDTASAFVRAYNSSVDKMTSCQERLSRN